MKRLTALLMLLAVLLVACEKNGEKEEQTAASTDTNTVPAVTTTADRAIPTESLPSTLPADEPIGTPSVG